MKCNIFNPLDKNNGEFYLFSQYADDCTREDANKSQYRVVPSKFATFNINLPGVDDVDTYIADAFQDYENRVLFFKKEMGDEYTPEHANIVLWKSLVDAGFIKPQAYRTTDETQSFDTFMELNFIGDINIYNSKRYNDMNYNEIYCHISSENRSKYYNIEKCGSEVDYTYKQTSLLGWEDYGSVLPNGTNNVAQIDEDGGYSIFGNYVPNALDPFFTDQITDTYRPSTAEEIEINVQQEGEGEVFAVIGKGGERQQVTSEDGGSVTIKMDSNIREVTIYPSNDKVFIDGYMYQPEDTNMTGISSIIQNSVNGVIIDPSLGSIKVVNNSEDIFKINMIILFYDIYNNLDPANPVLLYKNVPMGVYFTGRYDELEGVLKNTVTKYSNNDEVFGQGSSYNLRICTRNVVTPQGMLKYDTQVIGGEESYDNLANVLGSVHDMIIEMKEATKSNNASTQTIKDHLALFKNNRTNVPYVREVNGKMMWFVNGRNTNIEVQK